jgi:hypothetical protein
MGSLQERMKVMKRIQVEATDEFVVELQHHGVNMGEFIISFDEAEFEITRGKASRVLIRIYNPTDNGITEYRASNK